MNSVASDISGPLTVKEALPAFFEKYHLGDDGGINSNWVKVKFGKFWFPIPNTASRKKALMFHDVHHITTGYESTLKGEAEIGAWEVSTGCGTYYAAWLLDLAAFALGLFLYPKATFRGFIRGQHSLNLYHYTYNREQLLEMEVNDLRSKLGLDLQITEKPKPVEVMNFILWSAIALLVSFMAFVAPYILVLWLFLR